MRNKLNILSARSLYGLFLAVIAFAPFYSFFLVSVPYLFNNGELFLSSIERILLVLFFVLSITTLVLNKQLITKAFKDNLNLLILMFSVLHLVYYFLFDLTFLQEYSGIKTNLSFLAFYVFGWGLSKLINKEGIEAVVRVVVYSMVAVASLGLIQLLLPHDFLTIFGYGEATIKPFIYIKDTEILRIFATTGGPNQLGAMLVLPISLVAWKLINKEWTFNKRYISLLAVLLIALFFTHSRSGWIGVFLSLIFIGWYQYREFLTKEKLVKIFGSLFIVGSILILLAPKVPIINSVLLHGDEGNTYETLLAGSTMGHLEGLWKGTKTVINNPLGLGVGSAGPASFYGDNPIIPESYFLQIGIELGVVGLLLFVAITYLVAKRLWNKRSFKYAIPVLGAFIGLTFTNLLLHSWADGPTAIIWWGVAGLVIGHEKTKFNLSMR